MSPKYKSNSKNAKALVSALKNLPDNWVMCRDVRHSWKTENDYHVVEGSGRAQHHVGRDLTCTRCGVQRHDTFLVKRRADGTSGLERESTAYNYPDGYQIKGLPRGVKPAEIVRNEQYLRALNRATVKRIKTA